MTVWLFLAVALAFGLAICLIWPPGPDQSGFAGTALRDPKVLTLWLYVLLIGLMTVPVVSLLIACAGMNTEANDYITGMARLAFYVPSAIAILVWIYRANWNAWALGASGMEYTPGWSVGWYFVPIYSFWKPYQVMREIWHVSAQPKGWQSERAPALVGVWWFLFLADNFLIQAVYAADTPQADYVIASDVVEIALCLVFLAMVRQVNRNQLAAGVTRGGVGVCSHP